MPLCTGWLAGRLPLRHFYGRACNKQEAPLRATQPRGTQPRSLSPAPLSPEISSLKVDRCGVGSLLQSKSLAAQTV